MYEKTHQSFQERIIQTSKIRSNEITPILGSPQKEPAIPKLFMYDDLAKLLQKGLAEEGRFSERLSIF